MAAALASPLITNLLSLGSYAEDLFERCLAAPVEFQEARAELLALQTALNHLENLTKTQLFAASGSSENANGVQLLEGGKEKLTIEGKKERLTLEGQSKAAAGDESKSEGGRDQAVTIANGTGTQTTSNSTSVGTSPSTDVDVNSLASDPAAAMIPAKTRADLIQLTTGCRAVLKQFDDLLEDHQGMKDLPTKPPRNSAGIMQLFVGRPSGVYDRYRFAQEAVQKVNAIRAKLTYHSTAINLMLTVLGSSSLGRIEGSLSKLETMLAAAAEEQRRVHTHNVNYYVTAHQNNQYLSPEQQEFLRQQQFLANGMGMGGNTIGNIHMHRGPAQLQSISEQQYFSSLGSLTGMRGGSSGDGKQPKLLKAKGDKTASGFWGGGHVDPDDFFANMNSWSARPKTSGKLQSEKALGKPKHKDKENTFLGALGMSSRSATDTFALGGESKRRSKPSRAQRLMTPVESSKAKYTMAGANGEHENVKSSSKRKDSSKRREKGSTKEERTKKAKRRISGEEVQGESRIQEIPDGAEKQSGKPEGEAVIAVDGAGDENPAEGDKPVDKPVDVPDDIKDKPDNEAKPDDGAPLEEKPKSVKSTKSKTSEKEMENEGRAEKEPKPRKRKEKEKENSSSKKHTSSRSIPPPPPPAPPLPPPSEEQKKRFGGVWGDVVFGWGAAADKKKSVPKPIAVPRKKASVASIRHTSRGIDAKSKSRKSGSAATTEEERERRKHRKEKREKGKEKKGEVLGEVMEEVPGEEPPAGAPEDANVENPTQEDKKDEQAAVSEGVTTEATASASATENQKEEEAKATEVTAAKGEEVVPPQGMGEAPSQPVAEDEKDKKERRKKRKEGKEGEEKDAEKKHRSSHHRYTKTSSVDKGSAEKEHKEGHHHHHDRHHKSSKDKDRPDTSTSKQSTEKEKEKKTDKDKLKRRDSSRRDKEKDKKSKRDSEVVDKKGMLYDYDRDQMELRKKMRSKEQEAPTSPTSIPASPWGKAAALGLVRLTMGGQKAEEARRKIK